MRKTVFFAIFIFLGLFAPVELGIGDMLFAFLVAGAVPGTTMSLSPSLTMAILTAVAIVTTARITPRSLLRLPTTASVLQLSKQHLPKRRYTRIQPVQPVQSIKS